MDTGWMTRARSRMREVGISQEHLARELGCTRGAVGHYLSGRRNPSLDQMEAMARALEVELMWLLRGESATGVTEETGGRKKVSLQIPVMGDTEHGLNRDPAALPGMRLMSPPCYGIKVTGAEYSPRLYAGEIAVFDPGAEPAPGDEVFIQFQDGSFGLYSLVNAGRGRVTLESLAGERIRSRANTGDVRTMHRLVAVFRSSENGGPES